jgi:hypothetical protein
MRPGLSNDRRFETKSTRFILFSFYNEIVVRQTDRHKFILSLIIIRTSPRGSPCEESPAPASAVRVCGLAREILCCSADLGSQTLNRSAHA